MGKSIRNTDTQTVSSKDDVLSLLSGGEGEGPDKPKADKPNQDHGRPEVRAKEEVMDLLTGTVKKKDTDSGSSGTSSLSNSGSINQSVNAFQNKTLTGNDVDVLSRTDEGIKMGLNTIGPESKEVYATAHNGLKKADLATSVTKLIDQYYPASKDPNQNRQRGQILESVWGGDQNAISKLKTGIVDGLEKKIQSRQSELWQKNSHVGMGGVGSEEMVRQIDMDPAIRQLRQQQEQAKNQVDEYGKMAMASSKDMEAWLNLDKQHPNIRTSVAAEKLGRMIEERYGADRTSPNHEYDRMRTGFEHIIKGLQMDVNEALAYGIPTKNGELLKRAKDKLETLARYRELYDRLDTEQFPDVGLDKTARYLGDIIAEKHPNKLIRTKEDVREAGQIANERSPGFIDKYGKFVDVASEKQAQGTFIPRGGGALNELIGGITTSAGKEAIDLLKWRANVFGYESDKEQLKAIAEAPGMRGTTQSKTEPTKIVYDKEGRAYREMPNENYGIMPWNNFFRFAGESIPGLVEFVGTEGLSGAAATKVGRGFLKGYNAVGKEVYATTNALIGAKDIYEGYEATKLGKNFKEVSGLIGASYITSYNGNREFADANIDDKSSLGEAKKTIAANFLTLANAGIFHMLNASPSKMVEAAISKNVMPEVVEMLEKNSWEQLDAKTTEGFLKGSLLPRVKAVADKFAESAGSGVKMGTASLVDQKLKDLVGIMTNRDYKPSTIEDNVRAFAQQAVLMTTIGLPGMISTGIMSHSAKESLHQAGLYAPQYIDMINERMNNGELDTHQAAGMISVVKTMHEELTKAAGETNDDGTPLSTLQIRDVAIANFRKRTVAAMEENGQAVKSSTEPDKEIKEIKKENAWQSIEDTPTFKSIAEVGESGEKGGKVKSMSDIDPLKRYFYEKDGVEVAESGADLINHLETGDIYEKEKPDDQVQEGAEAPPAEGKGEDAKDQEKAPVGGYKPNIRDDYFAKADFFTPEEKERFASLDDAGKDKMIDDKRAELSAKKEPSSKEEATKFANELKEAGVIPDTYHSLVTTEDATPFWKMVAQQAENLDSNGGLLEGDPAVAEKATVDAFGKTVVDYAKELFPRSELVKGEDISPQSGGVPHETSDAVKQQRDALQGSYDRLIVSGLDPNDGDMVRLRERIDNLSPKTNDNAQNVEEGQGAQRSEGGEANAQESGQEKDGQKEGVLTPESDGGGSMTSAGSPLTSESKSPVVGIRDSIVNVDRIHRGLQPLVKEFVRGWGKNWDAIKRKMAKGFSPRNFIESTAMKLANGKRVMFSDLDYATLLFDRLDIQNNIAKTQDVLHEATGKEGEAAAGEASAAKDLLGHYNLQLEQNDIVARKLKSESGRALAAIQMMTKMNGDLVRWSEDIAAYYKDGKVPDTMRDFVARIEKQYKETADQLQKHYEEVSKKAAEEAFKRAQKEQPKSAGKTGAKPASVKAKGKDLADRIRKLRPGSGGTAQANIFGLPVAVYDTALVAIANAVEAGAKLIDAIQSALKDVKFDRDEDRAAFISHLQNAEDPERPEAMRAGYIADLKNIAQENGATGLVSDAVKPLRELMTSYVKDGTVKSLDELVKKTHEDIREFMPSADERDIRDAFSGHGLNPDSETRVKSELTRLKEEAKAVSVYQDLLERPVGETPAQEAKRMESLGKRRKKVEEYMKEAGIEEEPPVTSPEAKKALALERAKKRTQQIITDLNRQIASGERKERNNITPDHELSVLRAERKRLSDQLNEIDAAHIPVEEKIKRTEDALNRQISNYERQIKEGLDPLKPKEDRPSTKQIEELRARKNELKKQVEALRAETNPKTDPAELALRRYNESLARQIVKLDNKIADKDYQTEEDKKVPFKRDNVSLALETRLKKLQSDFYATKRVAEATNKKWFQKVASLAAATKRSFVLSRISTFGRLGAAVAWNTIFEPGEAVQAPLQYVGTKVGFGRKINALAERYGVGTASDLKSAAIGEAAAFKALASRQTWKDFVSDAKNGYSELSLLYGHGQEHAAIPKEARDTWQNIEHGLESFGRAHGAVKGVYKRMEFERSYVIRKEALKRKGEDVDNPVIQQSIGAMAYQDALRSILMENNWLSDKYQAGIHQLQNGGFGANILALTLQEMMPIVKIPTNLVLNAGRATLGTPLAGLAIVSRGIIDLITKGNSEWGISKMSPSEADAILRNFRKGNVGMALMLAGYFAPSAFGASHYYQRGTDQPEGLEEGEVKFFGLTVPKWLADNPYLVTMKIGASLRNAFDYYTDQKDVPAPQAAIRSFVATAANALKETPIAGTPASLINAAEGYGGDWFWYNQIKSTLEPGLLQEIAEDTDNQDGWYKVIGGERIKRKPSSIGDALKTGIPGLREDVEPK